MTNPARKSSLLKREFLLGFFHNGRMMVLLFVFLDVLAVLISYTASYYLRFGGDVPQDRLNFCLNSLPTVILLRIYFLYYFGLYQGIAKYASIYEVVRLFQSLVVSSAIVVVDFWLSGTLHKMPRSILIIDWSMSFLLLGGLHFLPRILQGSFRKDLMQQFFLNVLSSDRGQGKAETRRRVLIVGAGDSGAALVKEMKINPRLEYSPVGFIDDDPGKIGKIIHGIKVLGSRSDIENVIKKHAAHEVIISIASSFGKTIREITDISEAAGAKVKKIPSLYEIVDNKVSISHLRNIQIEDLLGRSPVDLSIESISNYVKGRVILVTGAGGSIGSELCRQIVRFKPLKMVLLGRGENSIHKIHQELKLRAEDVPLVQVIGDVINARKMEGTFAAFSPEIVFHAGADKHVPLMEMNPDEAVLNNIVGTKNLIEVAERYGSKKVICISTDKAVNPTSVMGACKRVMELLIQNRKSNHLACMGVRFGNVLGSRGSVIPIFRSQIERGGPVTVTHGEMKRFFMLIPEAAQLVIQAGAMGENGDLFVLEMGEQVKILDMARTMIKLAGYEPDRDIEIKIMGSRPGEKLYEELHFPYEELQLTLHQKIWKVSSKMRLDYEDLCKEIDLLKEAAILMDFPRIKSKLSELVSEYDGR